MIERPEEALTVQELFRRQAARTPERQAVQLGDESLTYRQLDEKSDGLAARLRSKGAGSNTIVGILCDRSFEMLIGIYGILKAGGAYLPIPPTLPEARIRFMLEESGAILLLARKPYINPHLFGGEQLNLDDPELYLYTEDTATQEYHSSDLAYVIYTSGSTGTPKGVMIEHGSLTNRLNWMQAAYPIDENDTILHKTPFGFDVSVWELLWWGISGAKVCLLEPGYEKFPQTIVEAVSRYNITVIHFVPSMLNVFLKYVAGAGELDRLAALRFVFASGEALPPSSVQLFNELLNQRSRTRLINLYGPTEATIDVTYYDCPEEGPIQKVPIGKPITRTDILIVKQGQLQPDGEPGEICITGDNLARGYINRPELTSEVFVQGPTSRMYRTGDLGRKLPDGNIEYMGRLDHQVKINGQRIELGEIEAVIRQSHPGAECAVIFRPVSDIAADIVACIVSGEELSLAGLKAELKPFLPDYMLPSKLFQLDRMPLTANGKLDRAILAELAQYTTA
ncbi:amino acid adenylation domain-containing protein [Paenibacillus tritici]|uniref:amino acid adenylation domain-containing protein n=1 Tax=Paenibacillus tritici TaxID=1873425 RepID=UPI001BAB4FE3|nr:amino acid adenylation domain-containing protein [Paenibacillus tritici]QUL52233.1 amino acid adenylation domain-containing protein [Paenibacillus tritici]